MSRHRWGSPSRTEHETVRVCQKCGMVKVTRHEPNEWPWLEWYNGDTKIVSPKTPACEATA